ncbi:hypothetical protein ACX0G9_02465 [Flavitalea flava]
MLTPEEKAFLQYWKENRDRQKKIFRQFLVGIPIGLLFVIPIAINLFSGWDKRAEMEANSPRFNPLVLLIALLCIVCFTAIFYRQHRWDQYEQRYLELKARQSQELAQDTKENKDTNENNAKNELATGDITNGKETNPGRADEEKTKEE